MSGNREGGLKAHKTRISRYGKDFYVNIARKGGSVTGVKKGFAANVECNCNVIKGSHYIQHCAGHKAGTKSKVGHKFIEAKNGFNYYINNCSGRVVKYKHDSKSKKSDKQAYRDLEILLGLRDKAKNKLVKEAYEKLAYVVIVMAHKSGNINW